MRKGAGGSGGQGTALKIPLSLTLSPLGRGEGINSADGSAGNQHNIRDDRWRGAASPYLGRGEGMECAFTLIEVMIAITIFFMAMFAILGVLASGVRAAAMLRNDGPTAGMVASQLSVTNKLEEGSQSGTFEDIGVYKDYRWAADLREVATNGLFQVDISVVNGHGNQVSTLSVLLYRPDSQSSRMGLQSPR